MPSILRNFLNGLAFGITETIPGVSGGTIAIILGFYFELINAINSFGRSLRKNLKFLVPVALGTVSGIILFSSVINYLLEKFSFPTMLFFIGLIAGITPHIFRKVKEKGKNLKTFEIILMIIPFAILILISNLKSITLNLDEFSGVQLMIYIFFSGVLAAAALVIPGISGSFVLLLLGVYPAAIYSVSAIGIFLADTSNTELFLNICKVLGPLAAGVITGGLCMIRLIENLLKNYQKRIYSVIFGLLSGSLFALFREPMVYKSGISAAVIIAGIVTFSAGCAVSYRLGKKRL